MGEAPVCTAADVTVGLWIDDLPARVATPAYFESLRAANVDVIDIMVDTAAKGWDPKFKPRDLEKIGKLASDHHMGVALTVWPDPVARWIGDMAAGVDALLQACGAVELCQDTEPNWTPGRVQGFRATPGKTPIDAAGDVLVDALLELRTKRGIRLSLSTYARHAENGPAADIAPHMDLVFPQCYAVRNRKKKNPRTGRYDVPWAVDWDSDFGPAKMVSHTYRRTDRIPGVAEGRVKRAAGLAAYDQDWPGHTPAEALALAYDDAVGLGVREVRYWSSKWVVGMRRNGYALDFLSSLR